MTTDIMHVVGERFLLSMSKLLGLLLVKHVNLLGVEELGTALQQHINTLRSRGFEPRVVYVDPHKTLVSLQGRYPGIEIDPAGAGDHLNDIDTKIRRLKELMRSVIAGLPYPLAKEQVKDFAVYAVSRSNLKASIGLESTVCPRVRFTGYKRDYKTELCLAFGDYVEAYDPKSKDRSNDVMVARSELCVALYPSANRNGSWIFYNLTSKSYVRRSQWRKSPTMQYVIDAMRSLAGERVVELIDLGGADAEDTN
jgi:hypothetical protein